MLLKVLVLLFLFAGGGDKNAEDGGDFDIQVLLLLLLLLLHDGDDLAAAMTRTLFAALSCARTTTIRTCTVLYTKMAP